MNVDAQYALFVIPSFYDLIVDPLSCSRIGSDQHDVAALATHLASDPFLDLGIAALRDLLPVIVGDRLTTFDDADVTDLAGAPGIRLVVEAIKAFSRHCFPPTVSSTFETRCRIPGNIDPPSLAQQIRSPADPHGHFHSI